MAEKIYACAVGGTGCRYWNEGTLSCQRYGSFETCPILKGSLPNAYTKEEIEQGQKETREYYKELMKYRYNMMQDFVKGAV